MNKFKVEIIETLSRIVEVKADSIDDAIIKAREEYYKSEVVLDYNDYIGVEFQEFSYE